MGGVKRTINIACIVDEAHPAGIDAGVIGEVTGQPAGVVVLHTGFGGQRIVDMLVVSNCRGSAEA